MPAAAAKPPLSDATGEFGRRVREARTQLELSQEELAERAGVHWSYLGQVERGQNNLTLHNILKLAAALKVEPSLLVEGLRAPEPPRSRESRRRPRPPASSMGATQKVTPHRKR